MQVRPHLFTALAAMIGLATFAPTELFAQASRFVDGYSFGVGLSLYQGDLDRNPSNSPTRLLTMGNLHVMAGADRAMKGGRLGVELHYNRVVGINVHASGSHNVVSVDMVYGRGIGRLPVRAFAGLGPSVVFSSYDTLLPTAQTYGFATEGTGFDVTIPLGVVIQDRVRLSTRFGLLDRVDGTQRLGPGDLVSNISIVYRFATSL